MTKEEFISQIGGTDPAELAREFLMAETVCLFTNASMYAAFKAKVAMMIASIEHIAVVGSGNWRYSLNPDKNFREFGNHSDVDVAIISRERFTEYWEEMRMQHREHFYALRYEDRQRLRRSGENVYSGFISPTWIPNRDRGKNYEYKRMLNALSDKAVRFLQVKMLFFKNEVEAVDYYARGFQKAKEGI